MTITDAREYLKQGFRPVGVRSSVHYSNFTRFEKAMKQATLEHKSLDEIIRYTNEYLTMLGMKPISDPIQKEPLNDKNLYQKIKEEYQLRDERDIVWMKFTEDGFLGVVACSNDINFQIPCSKEEYQSTNDGNAKTKRNRWKFNTSGIIIHSLQKTWNNNFAFIFPLPNIPDGLKRGDIEKGIGNYLIKRNVPILDYYSHRY